MTCWELKIHFFCHTHFWFENCSLVHGDHKSVLGQVGLDDHDPDDQDGRELPHVGGYGLVEGVVSAVNVENAEGYVFHKHFCLHKLDHWNF